MNTISKLVEAFASTRMSPQHCRHTWQPAVDIYRFANGWLLKFDLAGIRQDEVQIQVQDRWLTVAGNRRDWRVRDCQQVHRLEIAYSRFERTIEFPEGIDGALVTMEYMDGMLFVRLNMESQQDGSLSPE